MYPTQLERILVVEDDSSQGRLLEHWLRAEGYAPTLVGTVSEGLLRLREEHWSLVLSDVDLPGENGLTLLRESKRVAPTTPAVMMTGHSAASIASEAISRGADGYLLKPLSRAALLKQVSAVLARRRGAVRVLALGVDLAGLAVGCGGTLGRHALGGGEVHLTITGNSPNASFAGFPFSELVALDLGESELLGRHLQRCLEEEVRRVDPDVVFLPSTRTRCVKARAVHSACRDLVGTVAAIYAYATCEMQPFAPVRIQPIEGQLDGKLAWMAALGMDAKTCGLARGRAKHWGAVSNGYAEAFEVVFQLGS